MSIILNDVTKKYQITRDMSVTALGGFNARFSDGVFMSIMGPSGCGKSTLLNIIAGLDRPDSGKVLIDGKEYTNCSDEERSCFRNQNIGYVMQNFGLIEDMSVKENLLLPIMFAKRKNNHRSIQRCLEMVGMEGMMCRRVSRLSGGQKQRIAIARALVMKPRYLLADEPTGALDSTTAMELMNLFGELNRNGNTIIVVTHDAKVAAKCSVGRHMLDGHFVE